MALIRRPPLAALVRAGALLLVLAGPSTILADEPPPDGFHVGPMFVAPSLVIGAFVDSNPFFRSDDTIAPGEKTKDEILRTSPGVVAILPIRNSRLRAAYEGVFRNYGDPDTESNDAQSFTGDLSLLFASFDRLTMRVDRSSGAAETLRFDGGEAVYDGTPFQFATYGASMERREPGHFGYAASLQWSRLAFASTALNFFESDGWDGLLEARFAMSPRLWIVSGAGFRRFDHRDASDPTHSVYRQEVTDAIQAGMQGLLAHSQAWRAVLRYDRADYPGGQGSNYRGLGGELLLALAPGPTSTVTTYATRRSWSSFYGDNNYYVATTVGCRAERRWRRRDGAGIELTGAWNDYPDAVFQPTQQQSVLRRDRTIRADAYANLAFGEVYALRFTYSHQARESNVEGGSYRGDAFGVQFVLGWR